MRTLHLAGPLLAFVAVFAAYGCALDVTGLSPESTSTTGTPTTSSGGGAGPSSTSASSGGAGGGVTSTGSGSVSTGCASSIEICDDGMDNNCDSLTDCEDPQCTGPADGRACVDDPPAGWSLVAVAADAAATCPTGFGNLAKVAAASTSAATECTCSCGQAPSNPCVQGTLNLQMGLQGCGGEVFTPDVTGGCDPIGAKVGFDYKTANAAAFPPKDLSCPGTGVLPAAQPAAVSVTCLPTASAANGCQAGTTCLPKLATAALCIQKSGDVICPAGVFTNRQVVGAPGDAVDGRTCGDCTCGSSAASCANAKFTGYDDANCNNHAVSVTVDASCHGVNTSSFKNNDHFKYQATPDTMTCAPTGAAPTLNGGFTLKTPTTICCKP